MNTIINPPLQDQADSDPERVYRIMTPFFAGQVASFNQFTDTGDIIVGVRPHIPTITPAHPWGTARQLAVRPDDVAPANPAQGTHIGPGPIGSPGAGMSICAVLDLRALPNHRIPPRFNGTGSAADCIFYIERIKIVGHPLLRLHFDAGDSNMLVTHGVIEPVTQMSPFTFCEALLRTVTDWICLNM